GAFEEAVRQMLARFGSASPRGPSLRRQLRQSGRRKVGSLRAAPEEMAAEGISRTEESQNLHLKIDRSIERFFAIGDIHGCAEELAILLNCLENDHKLSEKDQVVFLGDYVDRGPNSNQVVELLLDFSTR